MLSVLLSELIKEKKLIELTFCDLDDKSRLGFLIRSLYWKAWPNNGLKSDFPERVKA